MAMAATLALPELYMLLLCDEEDELLVWLLPPLEAMGLENGAEPCGFEPEEDEEVEEE